ncbi:hypothetical protein HPP92_004915 [Vanilla planifolia]|uniref:Alliinase C-terminal domain-containing protein n=1 Tax=Vanilla planifolia TaxID=51239 RepID=A0A835RT13_VANPL|nr:hypothetical protein HPP92_004915 [Vanilla planifolia]
MVFEEFWRETGEASVYLLHGWQNMSYFSDTSNICWFLHPELASEIRRIHRIVGNAVADDDRFVVVGNGSTQLIQAALFALTTDPALVNSALPVPVVSAAPYYSGYPTAAGFLRSGLYQWAGDAHSFDGRSGGPRIEIVCSPNNPDGALNNAVVGSSNGDRSWPTINDLAYYWPQYTAITVAADHDIMLFTASKCTGHAGTRIGWALVKDRTSPGAWCGSSSSAPSVCRRTRSSEPQCCLGRSPTGTSRQPAM